MKIMISIRCTARVADLRYSILLWKGTNSNRAVSLLFSFYQTPILRFQFNFISLTKLIFSSFSASSVSIVMQLLVNGDPTTLSYWLNWRVFLCAVWVLTPMVIASFLIWKYDRSDNLKKSGEGRNQDENSSSLRNQSWKPCLKEVHPLFLMFFRMIAFCLLLVAVSFDVAIHGFELFYYYTQWTFTLVTIYFGFGSLLSMHGCFHHLKINNSRISKDTEQGLYVPIASEADGNGVKLLERFYHPGKSHALLPAGFWDNLFQALFQMTAGAVIITDMVYWCVIFPFIVLRDYEMNFLTVVTHTLNAILLLGDTALNSLEFQWFGISYFIMLTGIYVIFQWIVHACVAMWWPYPFLDLSAPHAPLWYLVVAAMHVPCYGIFLLVFKVKHFLFSRWFPHSYQCRP